MKDLRGVIRGLDVMIETNKRLTAKFSRFVVSATSRAKTAHNNSRSARGESCGDVQCDQGMDITSQPDGERFCEPDNDCEQNACGCRADRLFSSE